MSDTVHADVNGPAAMDLALTDPEVASQVALLRAQVRESFGKVVMALMALPRYRHQSLADLTHLVLDPLVRERVAIAHPTHPETAARGEVAGLAIWASVSPEVDASIREQIENRVFPIRLKAADWASGDIHWLLDVVAPNQRTTAVVIANLQRMLKGDALRVHPLITNLLDAETLKALSEGASAPPPST